tara:strand:+ start:201 stop:488 length:288 start_codon:yes stop_codon:yes gene_type:complete
MFKTTNISKRKTTDDGFHMKFKNGWAVSVQWHEGAYSDKGNTTAEIAAFKDNNWFVFDDENGDTVKGRQTPEEVAEFIKMISMLECSCNTRQIGE